MASVRNQTIDQLIEASRLRRNPTVAATPAIASVVGDPRPVVPVSQTVMNKPTIDRLIEESMLRRKQEQKQATDLEKHVREVGEAAIVGIPLQTAMTTRDGALGLVRGSLDFGFRPNNNPLLYILRNDSRPVTTKRKSIAYLYALRRIVMTGLTPENESTIQALLDLGFPTSTLLRCFDIDLKSIPESYTRTSKPAYLNVLEFIASRDEESATDVQNFIALHGV